MQFLIILVAIAMSVGISLFSGMSYHDLTDIKTNRVRMESFAYHSQISARSLRRDIVINPSQYADVSTGINYIIPDAKVQASTISGYRPNGRYRYTLTPQGRMLIDLTAKAENGPNGIHSLTPTVQDQLDDVLIGVALNESGIAPPTP